MSSGYLQFKLIIFLIICIQGYYCPEGTGASWKSCPIGKFGSSSQLKSEDDCSACLPGMYCGDVNLKKPNGNCSSGFFCPPGSINAWGLTVFTGNHSCPRGSYCPEGSELPLACPPGTYNPYLGIASIEECLTCTSGNFCAEYNMSTISGPCAPGYYCETGSATAYPIRNNTCSAISRGDVCPTGTYCPIGSSFPLPCPSGYFNDKVQQDKCNICPNGYYCPANSTSYFDCPSGYYCPLGTQFKFQFPCPQGTFSNETRRRNISDCIAAPPGYFVTGTGNIKPDGPCDSGFYCPSGAISATPSCNSNFCDTGGRCIPGQYCPTATGYPLPCPGGFYCSDYSGLPTGVCSEGYYCYEV